MSFYETLKLLCDKKGTKLYLVEKDLNYSNGSLRRFKNGGIPKGDRLQELANYFGVSTEYLLTGETSEEATEKESLYSSDPDAIGAADFIFQNPQFSILIEAMKKIDKRDIPLAKALLDRLAEGN